MRVSSSLSWMSDSTKEQAQHKLSKVLRKIGYPDTWRDYSSLDISNTALPCPARRPPVPIP